MTESEMMKIRNLGKKSFDEIRDLLREMDLTFKPEE
jgi:DNA-directed RNA polymerase alpha subunit